MSEKLAYSVSELQEVLGIGRGTALRLAREIGLRVSPRRLLVPRIRLEEYLRGGDGYVGNGTGKEKAPDPDVASRA